MICWLCEESYYCPIHDPEMYEEFELIDCETMEEENNEETSS